MHNFAISDTLSGVAKSLSEMGQTSEATEIEQELGMVLGREGRRYPEDAKCVAPIYGSLDILHLLLSQAAWETNHQQDWGTCCMAKSGHTTNRHTCGVTRAFRSCLRCAGGCPPGRPFGPPGRTGAGYRIDWRGEVLRMEPQYTCTPSRNEGMDRRRGIPGDPHRADCIPPLGCSFGAMVIRCSHSTNRGLISPAASPALSGTEPNRVAETMASLWETVPLRARSPDPQRPFAILATLIGKAIQFQGEAPSQSTTRWRPCRPWLIPQAGSVQS